MRKRMGERIVTLGVFIVLASASLFSESLAASDSGNQNSDLRIESQISTIYAMSPILRDCVLIVTVTDHNVSLVGKVGSAVEKEFAEEVAKNIDGVTNVDNMIGITDTVPSRIASSDPSFRQKIDDATTTAAIKSKLLWGSTTSGLDITVTTLGGKVRLDGTVYDGAQKDAVNRIAADTGGAIAVANEIVVFTVPPLTIGAQAAVRREVEDRSRPVSDNWITARIRSTFLLSPSVNQSDIGVATSEGSVSLTGLVTTAGARMNAISLAENTRGVRSVDSSKLVTN